MLIFMCTFHKILLCCIVDVKVGSVSSSVTVDVRSAAVTEELVTMETVDVVDSKSAVRAEALVEEQKPVAVEKAPPRLEEFPKPQALKEGETLVLSCKVSGRFRFRFLT